jgi:dihydroorotase-like cyclic amidohydrolase
MVGVCRSIRVHTDVFVVMWLVRQSTTLLLRGGTVVNASGSERNDVLVRNGRIVQVAADIKLDEVSASDPSPVRVIDVTGKLVLPGGIDTHTHCQVCRWWQEARREIEC